MIYLRFYKILFNKIMCYIKLVYRINLLQFEVKKIMINSLFEVLSCF